MGIFFFCTLVSIMDWYALSLKDNSQARSDYRVFRISLCSDYRDPTVYKKIKINQLTFKTYYRPYY